jgi:prepilin-type N-terminal cleavage/methylation domain-containing protein
MKKGFSLVEIMIVMVIIGIIVALGIKGGALVNASRIRAEIAKLRNFETGFASYFLKHNSMPPYTGNDNDSSNLVLYNTDQLVTRGVISSEDVPATFSQNQQPWMFCKNIATEDNGTYFTPAGFAVDNAGAGACTSAYTLNNELICNIETILDDGNLYKGAGRVTNAGVSISDNCDAAINKSTYSSYIYVAFSPNSQIPLKSP